MLLVVGAISAIILIASFVDLSIGALATLASDAVGALRRLGKGSQS